MVVVIWPVIIASSTIFLTCCYAYQFTDIQNWLKCNSFLILAFFSSSSFFKQILNFYSKTRRTILG